MAFLPLFGLSVVLFVVLLKRLFDVVVAVSAEVGDRVQDLQSQDLERLRCGAVVFRG